jgi:hypothetical protein
MNCPEFELIVGELAEDQLMSAKTRVSALAHAESCERCARRLANERTLSAGLIALAESTASEAPARLKQSLRAAFDAQKPVAAPNVVSFPARTRQWRWALAAAAAAAIVFAVTLSVWLRGSSPKTTEIISTATPTPTVTPAAPALNSVQTQLAGGVVINTGRRTLSRRMIRTIEDDRAASYIPLTYATNASAPQDKLVVRVEVSRATLIGMGLPLDAEQGSELVKADLMVGVDGVPLAIRFVKPGEAQGRIHNEQFIIKNCRWQNCHWQDCRRENCRRHFFAPGKRSSSLGAITRARAAIGKGTWAADEHASSAASGIRVAI